MHREVINPADGATLYLSGNLELKWEKQNRVEKYHIQVSKDFEFNNLIVDLWSFPSVDKTEVVFSLRGYIYIAGGQYFWRVRAFDGNQFGNWTEKMRFNINY